MLLPKNLSNLFSIVLCLGLLPSSGCEEGSASDFNFEFLPLKKTKRKMKTFLRVFAFLTSLSVMRSL